MKPELARKIEESTQWRVLDINKVVGGRRVDSSNVGKLIDGLNALQQNGNYSIVMDFSEIDYFSSSGIRSTQNAKKIRKDLTEVKSCWLMFQMNRGERSVMHFYTPDISRYMILLIQKS
jgi:anti-anti-sigma regulatory factor